MKKVLTILFAGLLSACMILAIAPKTYAAGLTVSGDNAPAAPAGGVWQLADGEYDISGTISGNESIEVSGNATLHLNGASITCTESSGTEGKAAVSIMSGTVNLVITGDNTVQGSPGYAGIYVAEGAELIISGDGILNAKGGDGLSGSVTAGGAGIGGNGAKLAGSTRLSDPYFGSITIAGGTVNAVGGAAKNMNAGGGAGIGGGGESTNDLTKPVIKGEINITGGTVNATGGDGHPASLTGGGAGIGSGGTTGGGEGASNSEIKITVADGVINAEGLGAGAGVGGGANSDGGMIEITGGNVIATGGCEIDGGAQSGPWGGAGIGGGDNGGVTLVTITGGTVTATAVGAAAGIGAGHDWFVGTISEDGTISYGSIFIGGDADVTAYGGSHPTQERGGAGIGASESRSYDNGFGEITIKDNAKVRAYAGKAAQALGVATYYEGTEDPNKVNIDTFGTDIQLFNRDTVWSAFWGQTEDGMNLTVDCEVTGYGFAWYTLTDGTFPAEDTETYAASSKGDALRWIHTAEKKIQITYNGSLIKTADHSGLDLINEGPGNWAVNYCRYVNVTYDMKGGAGAAGVIYDEEVAAGTEITVKEEARQKGFRFLGYKLNDTLYKPGDKLVIEEDVTFEAQWEAETETDAGDDDQAVTDPNTPNTADNNRPGIWLFVVLLSGAVSLGGYTVLRNKKQNI